MSDVINLEEMCYLWITPSYLVALSGFYLEDFTYTKQWCSVLLADTAVAYKM